MKKIKLKNSTSLCKWLGLSILFGAISGAVGFLFYKAIWLATSLRTSYSFILFLLPIAALASVALNRALKTSAIGTNSIINSVSGEDKVNGLILPAVFISSVITHLFGGSAGREGAALQMGGGTSAYISKLFKLNETESRILTICGMAAFFAALFGTPIGASIFALEVAFSKKICIKAAVPTLISSCIAYFVSALLGAKPERFDVPKISYDISLILKVLLIAIAVGVVGDLFCGALRLCHKFCKKAVKSDYILIFIGGIIIVLLTVLVGNQDYNGSGSNLIARIFESGKVNYYDFLLKIIFTVITVSAGLKGGEIVPSFSIGATLGGFLALALGLNVSVGAVIGMAAIFNSVTKCPLATVFICLEMFGAGSIPLCILAVILTSLLSSKTGLYEYKQNKISVLNLVK